MRSRAAVPPRITLAWIGVVLVLSIAACATLVGGQPTSGGAGGGGGSGKNAPARKPDPGTGTAGGVALPTGNPLVLPRPRRDSARRAPAAVDEATGWPVSPRAGAAQKPRIIAWYVIGNSSDVERDRRIGWNIKQDGWQGFVRKHAEPAIALGFDAIQLHNPGGTLAREEMQPDQFVTAEEAGLTWISRGFVDAWRPVTGRPPGAGGVPVIAYMGMLPKNERLQGHLDRGEHSQFLRAIEESYRLPLEARMEIAFDALHDLNPSSWELQVYRLFSAMGVRTYVETAPNVVDIELYGSNFQIVNTVLDRALLNGEPWLAPLEQLTGERIVLLAEPPKADRGVKNTEPSWKNWRTWQFRWMAHWIDQGWSIAVNPSNFVDEKIRPWEAVEQGRNLNRGRTP
jgi:hypothetical protein